jgi:ATP-dependent Lhr-like helicase
VALIELARSRWVESVPEQTRCWPVLVHQLLALALQFGGITADACWDQLSRVPDFRGISYAEFASLVAHMKSSDFLAHLEN